MHAAEPRIAQLTEEQERTLVNEPKLLLIGILAISYWTAADMLATFRISKTELVRLLVHLDRMRILDLLPDNHIKVRLARNFAWRWARTTASRRPARTSRCPRSRSASSPVPAAPSGCRVCSASSRH